MPPDRALRRGRAAARAGVAGLLALAAGCGGPQAPARRVVLLTCDTLRADRLGAYGGERDLTPNLDALAADSLVFDEAYAAAPVTVPSLSALLTGRLPEEVGVAAGNRHLMPPEVDTVAEAAARAGIETAAVVSNWVLRRQPDGGTDEGVAQGFAWFDDRMEESEANRDKFERTAAGTTDAALDWAARQPADEAFLLWVHYQDPHGPYTPPAEHLAAVASEPDPGEAPLPAGRTQSGRGQIPSYQVLGDELRPGPYRDRYDAEVRYFDAEVGRLLDGLRERGLLEDALVVFTADHGESLGEGGFWFCHGENVRREVVRVPLLLRVPGGPSGREARPVSHLDLAPTLLAALGLPPGAGRGRSLLGGAPADARGLLQVLGEPGSAKRSVGLVEDGLRLVVDAAGRARLYDLEADPEEREDLAASRPADLARLLGRLEELARDVEPRSGVLRRMESSDRAALEALGYVERGGTDEP